MTSYSGLDSRLILEVIKFLELSGLLLTITNAKVVQLRGWRMAQPGAKKFTIRMPIIELCSVRDLSVNYGELVFNRDGDILKISRSK